MPPRSTTPALVDLSKNKARRRRRDCLPSSRTAFFSISWQPRFFFTWPMPRCCRSWEMLSKGSPKAAAPFMSACIIVTQLVIAVTAACIGKRAAAKGRKSLLLLGFGVLPIRGVLYTVTHAAGALIAIQTLDGVANAIFGIV